MIRVHVAQERNIKNVVERIIDTKKVFEPVTRVEYFVSYLFIRQKMSGIESCFVRFYAVSADCRDRITLDGIDKNRWMGDLIVHRGDCFVLTRRL